ncbi:kelch repeat-containing protein [Streptomyces sp. CNQ-509]|uniref:Kelch repeat-containing protein n=1 Tax=Streptomyces sp. CNQ-509 TaxID=444103 RepID=UPI00099BB136
MVPRARTPRAAPGGSAPRRARCRWRTAGRRLSSAELFDPATGEWTPAAPMADSRSAHPLGPLQDGRVPAAGGRRSIGRGRGIVLRAERPGARRRDANRQPGRRPRGTPGDAAGRRHRARHGRHGPLGPRHRRPARTN